MKIITENQNNDKETGLGEVGSRLVKLYPDFDVRRYGYSLLSKFLETFPKLKLLQDGTKVSVTLYEDKSQQERIEEYIMYQFGNFKVRDYGYSQFQQYIKSFPDVDLKDDGEQKWAVLRR